MNLFSKYNISKSESLYIVLAIISLVMYFFGHSTEWGQLPFPDKLFYVPCALTLIVAFTSKKYWSFTKSDILFSIFWILAFFNTLIVAEIQVEVIFNSVIGFLIFRFLAKINIRPLLFILVYFTPLILIIHYVYSNPMGLALGYRYGGFQGDPNCFSFAMNVLVYACCYVVNNNGKKWEIALCIGCIAGIIPLMLAAASRASLAIMAVLLVYTFKDVVLKNKGLAILVVLICIIFGGKFLKHFGTQIENVTNRYTETKGLEEDYRAQELTMVPEVLTSHPEYLLFGIGYSESLNAHAKFPEYYHEGRSHNTYMSVLLEEGLVGFILFILFLIEIVKTAWRRRHLPDGKLRILMMLATLFFIYTIYSLPFLPFWFILNIISNQITEADLHYDTV